MEQHNITKIARKEIGQEIELFSKGSKKSWKADHFHLTIEPSVMSYENKPNTIEFEHTPFSIEIGSENNHPFTFSCKKITAKSPTFGGSTGDVVCTMIKGFHPIKKEETEEEVEKEVEKKKHATSFCEVL